MTNGEDMRDGASGRDSSAPPVMPELPPGIAPEGLDYMRRMIEAFNRSSADLQEAYHSLRDKFDRLNLRLEETNRSLTASLAEQERLSDYLTSILESLSSGVLVVDTGGTVTLFNRCAAELTGIPVGEAVGKPYRAVMGDDLPDELTPVGTLATGKGVSQVERTLVGRNGEKIAVGYSISPLVNRRGEMTGAVEIFMDLRRIKALEDELSRMDKLAALGQMAAVMAHKIRNPLGGIAGFSGLVGMELDGNERGSRLVSKITEGVDKLNRIVTSLLSYTSQTVLTPVPFDLCAGFRNIAHGFEEDPPHSAPVPRFRFHEPDGPVSVEVDREQFEAAARRIVLNAIESIEGDNGEIGIFVFPGHSGFSPADRVTEELLGSMRKSSKLLASRMPCGVAVVADNGSGMDEEALRNLFVPFYTTKENGIGLGLATAKKIVEAHHGELWVVSVECSGTSVAMAFPKTSPVNG